MNKTDAICLGVIVLIIVAIASALTYNWYKENIEDKGGHTEKLVVEEGVDIIFDYTVRIRTSNDVSQCPVFLTTLASVALNDSTPKSVTFSSILGSSQMQPAEMTLGSNMIEALSPGFYYGIMGMNKGESKTIFVDKEDAYPNINEYVIKTIPLEDELPMYEAMDRHVFEAEYPDQLPLQEGQTFQHNYWGWTIEIDDLTETTVIIKHDPDYGSKLDLFPWNTSVSKVSSEEEVIVVRHDPTEDTLYSTIDPETITKYNETFKEIVPSQTAEGGPPFPGIITSIEDGITIDFNREIVGKDLIFEVKIIEILPGGNDGQ